MCKNKEKILNEYNIKKDVYESLYVKAELIIIELLSKKQISCNSIIGRLKNSKSLMGKIDKGGEEKYKSIDDVTDIAGVRIITYFSDDVDKVAELIEREFIVDFEHSIDKREVLDLDKFGYLSLHYICQMRKERLQLPEYSDFVDLKFEVQIRSILQHTWAEIEHDRGYKSEVEIPKDIRRNFSRLAGLLEIADKEFVEIRDKLQQYKIDVEKRLEEDKNKEVFIDEISIKAYLERNDEIKKFNVEISKISNSTIIDVIDIKSIIDKLLWLKLFTIHDINKMLESNKKLAYKMALNYLVGKKIDELNSGIGIFYLCYAELILKRYSDNEIIDYLEKCHVGSKNGRNKIIVELKNVYNENYN